MCCLENSHTLVVQAVRAQQRTGRSGFHLTAKPSNKHASTLRGARGAARSLQRRPFFFFPFFVGATTFAPGLGKS